ncbi:Androgen-binding protein homolog, partial [Lemmus lemmus]
AAEACIPFFEVCSQVCIGNKQILNAVLNKFDPSDGEREGIAKVMECFNDAGLEGKILKAKYMEAIVFSPECREYYTEDTIDKFKGILSKLLLLGK